MVCSDCGVVCVVAVVGSGGEWLWYCVVRYYCGAVSSTSTLYDI